MNLAEKKQTNEFIFPRGEILKLIEEKYGLSFSEGKISWSALHAELIVTQVFSSDIGPVPSDVAS